MSRAGSVRAGGAVVEIRADIAGLQRDLQAASRQMKQWGKGVATIGRNFLALGAAVAGPLALATLGFSKSGDELDKMSLRTGVAAESLAELGFAANRSGGSLSDIERGIRGMQKSLYAANDGLQTQNDAFRQLGLSVGALSAMAPEEQFSEIARAVGAVTDPTKRAALSMIVFGRAGSALLPLFDAGADGLAQMRKEAQRLGGVLSAQQVKDAAAYNDALFDMQFALKGASDQIAAALAPALTKAANLIARAGAAVSNFVRENNDLIKIVAVGAAVTVAMGGGLLSLGGAAIFAGLTLSGLATVAGVAGAALGLVLTPLVGIPLLLGVAGAAFLAFTETGRSVATGIADAFRVIVGDTSTMVTNVAARLLDGDLQSAADEAAIGLAPPFLDVLSFIQGAFSSFTDGITKDLIDLVRKAQAVAASLASKAIGGGANLGAAGLDALGLAGAGGILRTLGVGGQQAVGKGSAALDTLLGVLGIGSDIAADKAGLEASGVDALAELIRKRNRAQAQQSEAEIQAKFGGLGDLFRPDGASGASRSVQGFFDTQTLRGGGADSVQERQADDVASIARYTRDLARQANNDGLVFGD